MSTRKRTAVLSLALAVSVISVSLPARSARAAEKTGDPIASTVNEAPGHGKEITSQRKILDGKRYHVGSVKIHSTPDEVWSVLTDYDRAVAVFANVRDIKLLESKGNVKKVRFEVASLGGLWKFNYVLALTEDEPHRIKWHRHSGAFKENEGYWELLPADAGRATVVNYVKRIDGGMLMPQALVDRELARTMPVVLANLKTEAEKGAIRIAQKPAR
ncbi:MAG: SRPBCC family protein [Candidatus Melainabacteria bacterium]|nr:SRPBCC family protein [Candidatus Melainabacteria bacterium]